MIVRTTRAAVALLCATAVAVLPAVPAQADQNRDNQWHLRYLKITEAHKISKGQSVTVAVLDSGVDPHPDIRNNVLRGTATYPGGSGDGRQDSDPSGHGTGMAGLIAAHGRGDSGALGIAPNARILPIQIGKGKLDAPGTSDAVAGAIEWATMQNADVISISWSGTSSTRLRQSIEAALKADIVVVSGVGNSPGILVGFPAAIDGVVAVGATDRNGKHADISIPGDKVVISAPGVDIYSTSVNGRYRIGTGTSPSTAIVAGAAALIRSKYPDLSAKEVVHRLTATADDKGAPGRDEEYGYGVLDIVAALTADVPPLEGDAGPTGAATPEQTRSSGNAAPDGGSAGNVLTTVALVGCGAVVLFGLLITFLIIMLVRRKKRAAPRAPY